MLSQISTGQAFDVGVFNRDSTKAIDQPAEECVQVIPPPVGEAGVATGQSGNTLAPCLGASFTTSDGTLAAAQPLGGGFRPFRTRLRLPVAQRNEAAESEVDADAIRSGSICSVHLDVKQRGCPECACPSTRARTS
jgi:hypothetical protein